MNEKLHYALVTHFMSRKAWAEAELADYVDVEQAIDSIEEIAHCERCLEYLTEHEPDQIIDDAA